MKRLLIAVITASTVGCATLTEEAMTPIALSFSDGSDGQCNLTNKRGAWPTPIPAVVSVRKSDDALKYQCKTEDGREALGSIESSMGAKIVASAVFIDFGITDAITDKHRKYAESYVIPIAKAKQATQAGAEPSQSANDSGLFVTKLTALDKMREDKQVSEEEYQRARLKLFRQYMPEALSKEDLQEAPPK